MSLVACTALCSASTGSSLDSAGNTNDSCSEAAFALPFNSLRSSNRQPLFKVTGFESPNSGSLPIHTGSLRAYICCTGSSDADKSIYCIRHM
ncbi:hypothetical protein BCV70DRAFT_198569 [Testicularia cyperi]|uniref:Uncharacterized protein n=1 Tax=Testicularia cyperi TaxID=1882483 RepID=A0A317XW16_9BASI|nr:hypothetical protein BCV70DRAFT_198569 [Testicularia cyperi]